jgi:hypothetical protein
VGRYAWYERTGGFDAAAWALNVSNGGELPKPLSEKLVVRALATLDQVV